MKIGIITVHRAYNYGSVLQCYALQEYLKQQGHNVKVIDYRQKWTEAVYHPFSLYYIWHFLKKFDIRAIIDYWRSRKERAARLMLSKTLFGSFMRRFVLTSPCRYSVPRGFDIYLIGSDQLWTHQCVGGEDKFYLGNFKHSPNSKIIGYSLSASVPSLLKFGHKKLTKIVANFDHLSLREKDNVELINNIIGTRLTVTVDPTLLLDATFWNSMINDRWRLKNYVVAYQARPVVGNPTYLIDKARVLSEKMKCEVIDMSAMKYSVEDFIGIIKYAKCVLTTSYHATVFSVIMETPCYAIKLNDGYDVRYVDLLTDIGLVEELVDMNFDPMPPSVNFDGLIDRLNEYKSKSVEYLKFEHCLD